MSLTSSWIYWFLFTDLLRYDFFKAELLKTKYFDDNIICHFTASFAAVRSKVWLFTEESLNDHYSVGYCRNYSVLAGRRVESERISLVTLCCLLNIITAESHHERVRARI